MSKSRRKFIYHSTLLPISLANANLPAFAEEEDSQSIINQNQFQLEMLYGEIFISTIENGNKIRKLIITENQELNTDFVYTDETFPVFLKLKNCEKLICFISECHLNMTYTFFQIHGE